jgi:hypothetical protein
VGKHRLPSVRFESRLFRSIAAGRYFAAAGDAEALAVDLKSGEERRVPLDAKNFTRQIVASPTGEHFCQLNGSNQALLFETATGKLVYQVGKQDPPGGFTVYGKADGCAFTTDGTMFYYWGYEEAGAVLRVYDIAKLKVIATIPYLWGAPIATPDGKALLVPSVEPARSQELRNELSRVVPGYLAIWGLGDLKERGRIPRARLDSGRNRFRVAFAKAGSVAAVWEEERGDDGTVQLFDFTSGKLLGAIDLPPRFSGGQFSPDGTRFAIRSDGAARVLDVPRKQALWRSEVLPMHFDFCFTADSKALAMPAEYGVYFLDATSGAVRSVLGTNAYFASPHPTPDGHHLMIEDIRMRNGKPIRRDKQSLGGDLILLHRLVHLDTGREVFRSEQEGYQRYLFPSGGRKMIQLALRNGENVFDATCWEIPRR